SERELPLEPEPEIDQDRTDRDKDPDRAVGQQLAGYARADDLDAAILDIVAERLLNFFDRNPLLGVTARLLSNSDQHVGRTAELLQLQVTETKAGERGTHRSKVGLSRFRLHLDQCAAFEINTEIQAVEEIQRNRNDRHHRGCRKADAAESNEVE